MNLSAAVYMVLYDRLCKRQQVGLEPQMPEDMMSEHRGFLESGDDVLYDAFGRPVKLSER